MRCVSKSLLSIAIAIMVIGCSRESDVPASSRSMEAKSARRKVEKLSKPELARLELEQKNGFGIYNGTDWFLFSADVEVSGQLTNGITTETRRFRLYPENGFAIRPYTSGTVDVTDLAPWVLARKLESFRFVAAEGYR